MDEEKETVNVDDQLKNRSSWWIDKYKKSNPDFTGDIDDGSLLEYAKNGYSELEGKYNQMSGANKRLAELVADDPRLGAALSMVIGEEKRSLPYAIGKVFGKDWIDDDMEEFESGYQENLKNLSESKKLQDEAQKNVEESIKNIQKYASEKGLDEKQSSELNDGIILLAENILMGKIPIEVIEIVHKGLSYEQDLRDAIDTGVVQGRNARIDPELKTMTESPVVDMGSTSGSGKKRQVPKRGGSFYDGLIEEKI